MCPPNYKVKYYFSNPIIGVHTEAKDQHIIDVPEEDPTYDPLVYIYGGNILVNGPPKP